MHPILLTCNYSPWSRYQGGAQKSAHMLATAHAEAGYPTTLICTKSIFERVQVPKNLPYRVVWAPFFCIRSGVSSPLRFLNGLTVCNTAKKLVNSHTMIQGNGDEASLLARLHPKAFIYSSRYPKYDSFLNALPWNQRTLALAQSFCKEPRFTAMAMAMFSANFVTATSQRAAHDVQKAFQLPETKVKVIPNGIDERFLVTEIKNCEKRGFAFYGRLTRAKGCDILLRAYSQFSPQIRCENPLVFYGDGPLACELKRDSAAYGISDNVKFFGWADSNQLCQRLPEYRAVVLPSLEESFGNAMVETLALGQPLITTTAGSIPEVCGPWGVRVQPGCITSLHQAMCDILESNSRIDCASQKQWVLDRYSWNQSAKAYRELGGI